MAQSEEPKKPEDSERLPLLVSLILTAACCFMVYMLFTVAWEKYHPMPPVALEVAVGTPTGSVSADGRVAIRGEIEKVGEGETVTLPADQFLIIDPDVFGSVDMEVGRICEVQAIEGKCVLVPKKLGKTTVVARRRILCETLTVARTQFELEIVEPKRESVSISYLRGFYEEGKMWISGGGAGLLDLEDPQVSVDVNELVLFSPTDVSWEAREMTTNPDGYTLTAIALDPNCQVVEGSAVIAKRPGCFRVKLVMDVPKGSKKPAPIVVRIHCSGKTYDPGTGPHDEVPQTKPAHWQA